MNANNRAFIASLALGALASAAQAQNWPAFRGANASGVAEGAKPPLSWSVKDGKNVLWKAPIPGFSHASPVVWGDAVFVASAVHASGEPPLRTGLYGDVDITENEGEISWRVLALDKQSGKVLWEREVHKGTALANRHIKATHANSTPATDGKRLVFFFGSTGQLVGFDLAGNQKWKVDLGPIDTGWFYDPSYQWGHSSSPILWDGKVLLQIDRAKDAFLAAYDADTGKEIWKTPRPGISSWGTPTVIEGPTGPEIVTDGGKGIIGYDPKTGKELWKLTPTSEVTVATPVVGHGLVYISNGYRPVQPVYAIRPGGRGDISLAKDTTSSEHVAWSHPKGGTYIPTPIVIGDHFYTLANDGRLTCYDAKAGAQVYQQRVGGGRAAFTASPVAADGRIYLSSEDGDVYVIKAGPAYENLALSSFGESIMASPAISGDLLLVRTRSHLFALKDQAAAPSPSP